MEYRLRPVDYDPFDEDPTSPAEIPGFKLKPVDYDPFEEEEPEGPAFAGVAPAISAAMQAPGSTSREILTSGMRLIRGGDIKTKEQEGILDKMIRSAETQTKREVEATPKAKIIPGIPITARDIAELPSNLAYSMVAAGAGLAAGLPLAAIPEPTMATKVAAWGAGTAASGAAAYRMAKDQFSGEIFNLLNERAVQERGEPLTQDEWDKVYKVYESHATKYGLWEAIPEAISNALTLGIIRMAPKKLLALPGAAGRFTKAAADTIAKVGPKSELGKTLLTGAGKFAAMQMEELGTETITQMGQGAIEADIGMRETAPGVFEAMGEVAPQTFLLTSLMGGAGAVGSKAWDKWIKPKKKPGVPGEEELDLEGKGEKVTPDAMAQKLETDFRTGDLLPRDIAYIMGQFPKNHPVYKKGQTLLEEYVDLQQEQPIDLGRPLEGERLTEAEREQDRLTGRTVDERLGAIMPPPTGKSARESAELLARGPTYLPQDMDRLGRIADLNQERVQSELAVLVEQARQEREHAPARLPWAGEELRAKMAEEEERSRVQGIGGLAPYISVLLDLVQQGEPGKRMRVKDYDGTERWFGIPSSYPEFMRNQYGREETIKAIEKGLNGYEFPDSEVKQRKIWEDVLAVSRENMLKDIVEYAAMIEQSPSDIADMSDFHYNQMLRELRNEGYSTRDIQAAAERYRGAIQARSIAETSRRLGVPEEEILRAAVTGKVDLNQIWREATLSQEELEEYYDQKREGRIPRQGGEREEPGGTVPEEGAGGGAPGAGGILQTQKPEGQEEVDHVASAFDKAQKLGPKFVMMLTFDERAALAKAGFGGKGNVYDLDAILEAARARGVEPAAPTEEAPTGEPAPGLKLGPTEIKPEVDKSLGNRILADAFQFGDEADTQAVLTKGFNSLKRNRQLMVLSKVRSALSDSKVLDSVVHLVPVDVMDELIGSEWTPQKLLHDPSMLTHRLSVSGNVPIGKPVLRFIDSLASQFKVALALATTEKPGLPLPVGPLPAGDRLSTSSTGQLLHTTSIGDQEITTNITPTEGQQQAGNYLKGAMRFHGLEIKIENPKGSIREGTDKAGKPWKTEMKAHYGYIRRTEGEDGDQIDTFIGPKPESTKVYVIDQVDPKTKTFDEHKVMLGYSSEKQARVGYLANYERGWKGIGAVTEYDIEDFKKALFSEQGLPVKVQEKKPAPETKAKLKTRDEAIKEKIDSIIAEVKASEKPVYVVPQLRVEYGKGKTALAPVYGALKAAGLESPQLNYWTAKKEEKAPEERQPIQGAEKRPPTKGEREAVRIWEEEEGLRAKTEKGLLPEPEEETPETPKPEIKPTIAEQPKVEAKAPEGEEKAKVVEAKPTEKGKEAWEMTLTEYRKSPRLDANHPPPGHPWGTSDEAMTKSAQRHKLAIEIALDEGKPVPASVLADYPDLSKKPTQKVEKKPTEGAETPDILPIIKSLQPPGQDRALVSISELRDKANMPAEAFDKALLELAREGKIALHQHDFPSSLSEEKRKKLLSVPNPNAYWGGRDYYSGVVPTGEVKAEAKPAPKPKAKPTGKPLSDITVKVTAIRETTGEKLKIDSNAQEAVDEVNSKIDLCQRMLECLAS